MPKTLIGINIVSLVNLIDLLFPDSRSILRRARDLHFDLVQLLPIKGTTGKEISRDGFLAYCEDAWNPTTWLDFILTKIGQSNMAQHREAGMPKLHDLVLFPSPGQCESIVGEWVEMGYRLIGHHFSDSGLVEVSPKLDMNALEILKKATATHSKVVIDTYHLQRGYWPDEIAAKPERDFRSSPLGISLEDWLAVVEALRPVMANVIHLNLRDNQESFLAGRDHPTEALFKQWLETTDQFEERHIILEYKPPLTAHSNLKMAKSMLEKTLRLVEK